MIPVANEKLKQKPGNAAERTSPPRGSHRPQLKVLHLQKQSKALDRNVHLTSQQKQLFREQRTIMIEFLKSNSTYDAGNMPDSDDLSNIDPTEQWGRMEELDELADEHGISAATMKDLIKQKNQGNLPGVDDMQAESEREVREEAARDEAKKQAERNELEKQAEADRAKKEAEDKLAAEQKAQKEAEVQKQIEAAKRAKEAADKALEDLQASISAKNTTAAATPTETKKEEAPPEARRELSERDYDDETEASDHEDIGQSRLRDMDRQIDHNTDATRSCFNMLNDHISRQKAALMVFLPKGQGPQQVANSLRSMRSAGWLHQSMGFDGYNLKSTPIMVYLVSEDDANAVSDAIWRWQPGLTTAINSPSECSQQKQQARDCLRWIIQCEKDRVEYTTATDGPNQYEHRYSLQWPKSRLSKKSAKGKYEIDEQGDWWSVLEWQTDGSSKCILRTEYDHRYLTQTYRFLKPALVRFNYTAEETRGFLRYYVAEMFTWKATFEEQVPHLNRAVPVKQEQQDDKTPPPPALANAAASAQPQSDEGSMSNTWDPWKQSKDKGGKEKGGKSKGKNKGGKNDWWQNSWKYDDSDYWHKGGKSKGGKSKGKGGKSKHYDAQSSKGGYKHGGQKRAFGF